MTPPPVSASRDGIAVPADLVGTIDVILEGHRAWSVTPQTMDLPHDSHGVMHVPWPRVLRKYLDGKADVVLRHHQTDSVLYSGEIAFSKSPRRVSVTDKAGRPVVVTKNGRMNRPFETADRESVEAYLDRVEEVLAILRDCGLDPYIAWGTLLGAMRAGSLIGHDVDADVAYLSAHTTIVDVIRESFEIERALRARQGWTVRRMSGAFLAVFVELPDGVVRNLDVFGGYIIDGLLYQVHDVCAPLPRSAVLPTSSLTLEGRSLPTPADPAAWLEAAYGPHWETPDPGFSFQRSASLRRRNSGWLGGIRGRRDRWRRAHESGSLGPAEVSRFARWVQERDARDRPLVDLGCGRGADALLFAEDARTVLGIDFMPAFVVSASKQVATSQRTNVRFEELNFADARHALTLGARIALMGPVSIYSRRLLGDLNEADEQNFWRTVGMGLRSGGHLYLEFIIDEIAASDRRRVGPPTRSVDPGRVLTEVQRRGGTVQHHEIFKEPDQPAGARTCRLIAEWKA